VTDPEVRNRGRKGRVGYGEGAMLLPKKFYAKIMHFGAKFSLVLRCIQSMGRSPLPLESETDEYKFYTKTRRERSTRQFALRRLILKCVSELKN